MWAGSAYATAASATPAGSHRAGTLSGANAPIQNLDLKPGDLVQVNGREATFLYSRGKAATVRFKEKARSRVAPLAKVQHLQRDA
jgi:hypothetical protein